MKKIAFIINHLAFFESHIQPLAIAAKKRGYNVKIFCGLGGSKIMEAAAFKKIKNKFLFERFNLKPASLNFFSEINEYLIFIKSVKNFNPDIIHAISLKAIFWSLPIHLLIKIKNHICFVTGMGFFFTSKISLYKSFLKYILLLIFRFFIFFRKIKIIVENSDDYNFFKKKLFIPKNNIKLINGVGVDLKKYKHNQFIKKIVLFPARILEEKGIIEFLYASLYLSKKFPKWKFLVAGSLDYKKNNSKLPIKKIVKKNTRIKFLGFRQNMHHLFNKSSIVCLPSYREGFPKSIIEGSASGCAIVTTNVPGCRESIVEKKKWTSLSGKKLY